MLFFKSVSEIITHEENTKKNHKRVVSLYVIEISFTLINFNFDFLDLHNVFFENYTESLDQSFLKQFKTHSLGIVNFQKK